MLALLYLGLAICVGDRLCSQYYRFVSTAHRWATGTLVGLLLSSGFTYLVARCFASATNPLLWGDIVFAVTASIFLLNCPPKRDPSPPLRVAGSETWDWVALGLYGALACWMMFATLDFKGTSLLIGVTQWSDYGPNSAIVQSFVYGHNFPAEYPHFAGEPIRYHFLFYFQAGNLEFLGLNLAWSLNILSALTLVCMLAVVMALGELLFKSRAVGGIASAFFFFHGTLNLVPFLRAQPSVKAALLAIYHLPGYLSSGYPYRGEDWGIWTQVVYINQRHLASSIGIFLVVLFFLFDRYLERAKQRKLARAQAADLWSTPQRVTAEPSVAAGLPAWQEHEAPTSAELGSAEDWSSDPETIGAGETQSSGTAESLDESARAANYASADDPHASETVAYDEKVPQEPEPRSIGGVELSDPVESFEEPPSAANYASAGEARISDTLPAEQSSHSDPEIGSGSEAPPSVPVESHQESTPAGSEEAADEAPTFHSRAYDEYMGLHRASTPASDAQESEALEFVNQSSQETEAAAVTATDAAAVSATDAPPAPVPEPTPTVSRGFIVDLVRDNLANGRGFIFSGLLLGALPYWNSAVFTAAATVLVFLFLLFPYRRYMVGLAVAAAVVALPQVLSLRAGNARAGASLLHWGYTLGGVPYSHVLKYLGFTFGVKWVLILIGLLFGSWFHWRLFFALICLFVLTFCFQFSDEVLANHKFLNIWLVLANLFVGYGLWRLWHLRIKGWALPFRLVALILAAPIVAGGVIDLFPIHNATFISTGYANDRLIDWLRKETKPESVFLTDKFVNHPILLAGRRIFFGYTYFTWSAGYDLPPREAAYKTMFESKNAHQVFTLLKANHIDYVAFDDGIRGNFKNSNEQQVYAPNFTKAFDGPEYWHLVIYKVPENADFVPSSSTTVAGGSAPVPAGPSAFEGGEGKDPGKFSFPRGLAVDSAGNILVADTNNARIQKFSPTGVFLSVIGKPGSGPGEFKEPCGLALDSSGNIYVADVSNHRVQKLKPDGTFIAEWKGPDPGFYGPRDLAVGTDNSVYVVDQGHSRIVKYDSNGKVMAIWGTPGTEDGQFGDGTSVAVDTKNGRVYVADLLNKRIDVYDTNGKFIAKWPVDEWRAQTGWFFQDLAVDSQAGRVYGSSVATDEVIVFDLTGKKLASLKPTPPDKLVGAASVALGKGKIYVVNTFGNYVSKIDLETKP
jgi:DNA-binding beta-propeller fold protein YncE